jgi:hypothetical protein
MNHNHLNQDSHRDQILKESVFGSDVIHKCIKEGDKSTFLFIIKSLKGEGLSIRDKDYLFYAAEYHRYDYIKHLVLAGCLPYYSHYESASALDVAIRDRNKEFFVELIIACQMIKEVVTSPLLGDMSLLAKDIKLMSGKDRAIAVTMMVGMDFSELGLYISDINPIKIYALYHGLTLNKLKEKTQYGHIKKIIEKEMMIEKLNY